MGNQGAISKQPSQQRLRIAKLAPNVVNDGIVQFGGCQIHRCLGVRLPLKSGVLSFVQNVDKELRNGGKASTCGIHAGI